MDIFKRSLTSAPGTYSLRMQPATRNLRIVSLVCLGFCVISTVAVLWCLCVAVLLSADTEKLYRTWRASRLLFFAILCFFFAMGAALDALSRRLAQVREIVTSRRAKRIVKTALVFAIAVVFFYPPRPFVYPENGHWMNKSKAGTWEVSQTVAVDSYKRNIMWDCMLTFAPIAVLASIAVALAQKSN